MDDLTYAILSWLGAGNSVFRPQASNAAADKAFEGVIARLQRLREEGFISYLDGRITRTESGRCLLVGPVDLTPQGKAELERDTRLGPRPPQPPDSLLWRQ